MNEEDRSSRGAITSLMRAAEASDSELLDSLIEGGAGLDARSSHGATALHYAVKAGSLPCVMLLLEAGARLDILDIAGKSAAHLAAMDGHTLPILAALLDWDVPVDQRVGSRDGRLGRTLLHVACAAINFEGAELLIASGADVEARYGDASEATGSTALHAVFEGITTHSPEQERLRPAVVRLLLDAGEDPSATDGRHQPLHLACLYLCAEEAKALLDAGADPNAVNGDGKSPLDLVSDETADQWIDGVTGGVLQDKDSGSVRDELRNLLIDYGAE